MNKTTTLNKKAFAIAMVCTIPAAIVINALLPSPDEVAAENKARREAAALVKTEVVVPQPAEKIPEPTPVVEEQPVVVDTASVLQEACETGREYRSMVDSGDARTTQAEYEAKSYADYVSSETGVSRSAIYNQVQKGLWQDACY